MIHRGPDSHASARSSAPPAGWRAAGLVLALGLVCISQMNCVPADQVKAVTPTAKLQGRNGPPFDSGKLAPFGYGVDQTIEIENPPAAASEVAISVLVTGALGQADDSVRVLLNGKDLGTVLRASGRDCAGVAEEVTVEVPAETFNQALAESGRVYISLQPSQGVDPTCAASSARVYANYCTESSTPPPAETYGGGCNGANPFPGAPRIVSAISTGNTSVRVIFNEPVADGADDPSNYSIIQANIQSEAGALAVIAATPAVNGMVVNLETASQNELTYELIAGAIFDLAGNSIAPPDLLTTPSRTQFAGTPATGGGVDTDKDGLSDAAEQSGWTVVVELVNGTTSETQVTSDRTLADTDNDGVSDLDEFRQRSNPRSSDTDGDTISDYDEWNVTFSSLTDQDSDDDNAEDGLEVGLYKTSPIVADTDGDGLSDNRELFELNRDPRIGDLPRPRLTVGQVRLRLDERYSFTDENGEAVSIQSSSSSALAMNQSSQFSRVDTHTSGANQSAFVNGSVEGRGGNKESYIQVGVEGGYSWNWSDENSSSVSQESARETQSTFENSLSKGRELSNNRAVTREIVGASIDLDVMIEDAGSIAFTISNLQVSVLQPSPFPGEAPVPVATLLPASELIGGESLVLNLGPLVQQRGPIIFRNTEVFPSLVEELMRSPRGLIFRISNFDITDEFGRNFAFASQEARDRSVGITIDRGDADPIRLLVALNGQMDTNEYVGGGFVGGYDANTGRALGIPMDYILQDILGYQKNRIEPDGIVAGANYRADTVAAGDDVQVVPAGTEGLLPHNVIVTAGQNGLLDTTPNADDRSSVITGYETSPTCGPQTAESIIEPRSGGNGIANSVALDDDVQLVGVNAPVAPGQAIIGPGSDGVIDSLPGGDDLAVFPGQIARLDGIAEAFVDGDGIVNTGAQGDDVQAIAPGEPAGPGQVVITAGPNGRIDSTPAGDDVPVSADCNGGAANGPEVLVRFESRRSGDFQRKWVLLVDRNLPAGGDFGKLLLRPGDDVAMSFLQDLDRDGLLARDENLYGCSDQMDDTDSDNIDDFVEVNIGWTVGPFGQPLIDVRPDPSIADSDGDGLSDWVEQDLYRRHNNAAIYQNIFGVAYNPNNPISSNPRLADTDGDGISDAEEMNGYTIGLAIRAGVNGVANTEANGDDIQKVLVGNAAFNAGNPNGGVVIQPGPNLVIDSIPAGDDLLVSGTVVRTNPLNPDHDGDTRPDGVERAIGADPRNANDSADFIDADRDGLSDAEEEFLGWSVTVRDANNVPRTYTVRSNKFSPDTDADGLPDLLERLIGSDPTREDTDGDTLTDYNEFNRFGDYANLGQVYPNFVLNGANSAAYGTNPNRVDTDGDTLSDQFELLTGWRVLAYGDAAPRAVNPSPLYVDTDRDGLTDTEERLVESDPTDPDTDDDGRLDGIDVRRCSGTGTICHPPMVGCSGGMVCEGSDTLRPDVAVTITFERVTVSNVMGNEASDATPLLRDWDFAYGFRIPGSPEHDGFTELFADEQVGCDLRALCDSCTLLGTLSPSYTPTVQNSITFSVIPGDLLVLEGYMREMTDCPSPDSLFVSANAPFRQTYTFDQLRESSSFVLEADSTTSQGSALSYMVRVDVLVEVR